MICCIILIMNKPEIIVNFTYSFTGFLNLERKYTLELEYEGESRVVNSINVPFIDAIGIFFKKIFTNKSHETLVFEKFTRIDENKVICNLPY